MLFEDIIAPISKEEFGREYAGRQFLLLKPSGTRLDAFIRWTDVNYVLEHMRFSPRRLRVVQNGRTIDPDSYTVADDDPGDAQILDARRLERLLGAGASLVINMVDECFPAV